MSDAPEPIVDEHIAFAKALVSLAREHGADGLSVRFQLTGGRRFFASDNPDERQYNPTNVQFDWSEGRHGAKSRFGLRAEASISIEEASHEHS